MLINFFMFISIVYHRSILRFLFQRNFKWWARQWA